MKKNDGQESPAPEGEPNTAISENSRTTEGVAQGDSSHEEQGALKRLWHGILARKKISIPIAIILIIGILMVIPFTRYALAGVVLKQSVSVIVLDSETNKPVSSAAVELAGQRVQTNSEGRAIMKVPVGKKQALVSKKYYKDNSQAVFVPILKQKQPTTIKLIATGRQITVTTTNKITKKPLPGVTVKAADTEAKTDKNGKAVLVLPADKATADVTLSANGYNDLKSTIQISGQTLAAANAFSLVPSGKVYFLSNLSGKLDVVKTNLDGTERQIVLAGTGKEDKNNTVLLASRDWKYLTLHSKRDGGEYSKLFLIDTSNDKLTTMDEGDATFTLTGWSDHRFVYQVDRVKYQVWKPKRFALKSYDATTQKIAILDESAAEGDQNASIYESIGPAYAIENDVIYSKSWGISYPYNGSTWLTGKQASINTVRTDGAGKKVLKGYTSSDNKQYLSLETRPYGINEIYIKSYIGEEKTDEYENGQVKSIANISWDVFSEAYPTYLQSPSGARTFWSEPRDGKNTLFVGDKQGEGAKQVANLSEYQTFGWHSDNYLLVSKAGSELYVMSIDGSEVMKVSDYYKPALTYRGYGGGYGGL